MSTPERYVGGGSWRKNNFFLLRYIHILAPIIEPHKQLSGKCEVGREKRTIFADHLFAPKVVPGSAGLYWDCHKLGIICHVCLGRSADVAGEEKTCICDRQRRKLSGAISFQCGAWTERTMCLNMFRPDGRYFIAISVDREIGNSKLGC